MELIKVIFFSIGTFFGVENSTVFAETTVVNIDVNKKMINVTQNNLFSLIRTKKDSLATSEELYRLCRTSDQNIGYKWREEFKSYDVKTLEFISDKNKQQLNAKIELKYNTKEQLKDFSIDFVESENSYAIINIEEWNITTSVGKLKGNYWYFKDEISFTMTLNNIPEQYKAYQKSLYKHWKKVKP